MSRTVFNQQILFDTAVSGTLSGSNTTTGNAVHLPNVSRYSFHLKFDTLASHFGIAQVTGTFKLQASNDPIDFAKNDFGRSKVLNWVDIPNTSRVLSGSGDGNQALFNVTDASYGWVRGQWVNTIGSGTLTMRVVGKEGSS